MISLINIGYTNQDSRQGIVSSLPRRMNKVEDIRRSTRSKGPPGKRCHDNYSSPPFSPLVINHFLGAVSRERKRERERERGGNAASSTRHCSAPEPRSTSVITRNEREGGKEAARRERGRRGRKERRNKRAEMSSTVGKSAT
ncbi:uncharacterized protein LOC111621001 isoform X2 [Centruroides sculpturatus]|uniref:uncharacterized protein LOC111621001 isoform X2 n=1 Tax=Centruroides sculpturatus TaxID=218467 RepID=UPI000C6CD512|nr:uncharacterized protein LOC111621001 isoform X2 [Centruroides sculpturatus]